MPRVASVSPGRARGRSPARTPRALQTSTEAKLDKLAGLSIKSPKGVSRVLPPEPRRDKYWGGLPASKAKRNEISDVVRARQAYAEIVSLERRSPPLSFGARKAVKAMTGRAKAKPTVGPPSQGYLAQSLDGTRDQDGESESGGNAVESWADDGGHGVTLSSGRLKDSASVLREQSMGYFSVPRPYSPRQQSPSKGFLSSSERHRPASSINRTLGAARPTTPLQPGALSQHQWATPVARGERTLSPGLVHQDTIPCEDCGEDVPLTVEVAPHVHRHEGASWDSDVQRAVSDLKAQVGRDDVPVEEVSRLLEARLEEAASPRAMGVGPRIGPHRIQLPSTPIQSAFEVMHRPAYDGLRKSLDDRMDLSRIEDKNRELGHSVRMFDTVSPSPIHPRASEPNAHASSPSIPGVSWSEILFQKTPKSSGREGQGELERHDQSQVDQYYGAMKSDLNSIRQENNARLAVSAARMAARQVQESLAGSGVATEPRGATGEGALDMSGRSDVVKDLNNVFDMAIREGYSRPDDLNTSEIDALLYTPGRVGELRTLLSDIRSAYGDASGKASPPKEVRTMLSSLLAKLRQYREREALDTLENSEKHRVARQVINQKLSNLMHNLQDDAQNSERSLQGISHYASPIPARRLPEDALAVLPDAQPPASAQRKLRGPG